MAIRINLAEALKLFVDRQVASRGYRNRSEYLRDLIRKDQARNRMREALLEGAKSAPVVSADKSYFERLRRRLSRV